MKNFINKTFLLLCIISITTVSNAIIITPLKTFADCKDAAQFRDDTLYIDFVYNFVKIQDGTPERYNQTIQEFEVHRNIAVKALQNATIQQRKDVAYEVVKFFALKSMGGITKKMLKGYIPGISDKEIEVMKAVTKRSSSYAADIAKKGFKKSTTADRFIKDNIALFKSIAPKISPQITLFISGIELSTNVVFAYWNQQIEKDYQSNDIILMNEAIDKMILKHPQFVFNAIKDTKNKIDKECGHIKTSEPH